MRYSTSRGSPAAAERSIAPSTMPQSSGWTHARKRSRVISSSGEYPKIARAFSVTQKTPVPYSRVQSPASAASAASDRRSSLSRRASSARFRASALAKTCATSCRRFRSVSGQSRAARRR